MRAQDKLSAQGSKKGQRGAREKQGRLSSGHAHATAVINLDWRRFEYKDFEPRTTKQTRVIKAIASKDLVFLIGPAGTGKSYLAVAAACEALKAGKAKKLVIARPAVEHKDEELGFQPGDLNAKMDPYVRPIIDALTRFLGREVVAALRSQDLIEVTSISFLRGRSFDDCVLILDEMQNATPFQLKTAVTRAGENTTVIVTMDPSQCDLPDEANSAYHDLERFKLPILRKHCEVVEFGIDDVERSELVKALLWAYEE